MKFIGDLPVKDRIKFHDFIECLEEYKVPYIYVADKEGKNLIHIAVGRDFNRAKIELAKKSIKCQVKKSGCLSIHLKKTTAKLIIHILNKIRKISISLFN